MRRKSFYIARTSKFVCFSDESVRRKAIAEFIACLQEEPYSMSREEALGAIKSVSSVKTTRTIERDARIEDKLEGTLKELFNAKFWTRSEIAEAS